MSFRNWAIRSVLVWLLLAGLLIAATTVHAAVAARDAQWASGPLADVADRVSGAFWWIHLAAALLALLPAYWWQRRGGAGAAMVWIAFAGPLALVGVLALWRGTRSWDGLFVLLLAIGAFAMSFAGAVLIRVAVEPRLEER